MAIHRPQAAQRHLLLYLISADPEIAEFAWTCGVDRLFVDMETLGKRERQAGVDTPINAHCPKDISIIRQRVPHGFILARINPINRQTPSEVDEAIAAGASAIMLPMFRSRPDLEALAEFVRNRVPILPLVETREAAESIESWIDLPYIKEVYIGLNDLRLSLRAKTIFDPIASGLLERIAHCITTRGVEFGFGGIGRISQPAPVPPYLLLAEHKRLGSSQVILSRSFHDRSTSLAELRRRVDLRAEIAHVRRAWAELDRFSAELKHEHLLELRRRVAALSDEHLSPANGHGSR